MSGPPALSGDASLPRLLVLEGETAHEVFEVVDRLDASGDVIRVRSAFLFEIGEELSLRIEQDGKISEATARVRAHVAPGGGPGGGQSGGPGDGQSGGPGGAPITELEISDRSLPRPAASR